jgi:oligosaccharide repeat unit polymerase
MVLIILALLTLLLFIVGMMFSLNYLFFFASAIFPLIILISSYKMTKGNILDIRFLFLLFLSAYVTLPAIFCFSFGEDIFLTRFKNRIFCATVNDLHYSFILHILSLTILFISSFWSSFFLGRRRRESYKFEMSDTALKIFNIIFLLIILFVLVFALDIRNISKWEYVEFHKFSAGKGILLFWLSTFPFFIGVNIFANKSKKLINKWALLFLIIAVLLAIITGKRSYAFPSLIGIFLYLIYKRKINWIYTFLIILILYLSMQIFGIMRAFKGEEKFIYQIQKGYNFFINNKEMLISDEFSASVVNTTGVIRLIKNEKWRYNYGKTFLEFFRGMIPKPLYPSRGEFISQRYAKLASRERYRKGGGFGFSVVGDFYLNFGLLGIIILFILLGFILRKFEAKQNYLRDIFKFGMLPSIIFFPRTSLSGSLKTMLMFSGIPFLLFLLYYSLCYKYLKLEKKSYFSE